MDKEWKLVACTDNTCVMEKLNLVFCTCTLCTFIYMHNAYMCNCTCVPYTVTCTLVHLCSNYINQCCRLKPYTCNFLVGRPWGIHGLAVFCLQKSPKEDTLQRVKRGAPVSGGIQEDPNRPNPATQYLMERQQVGIYIYMCIYISPYCSLCFWGTGSICLKLYCGFIIFCLTDWQMLHLCRNNLHSQT